MTLSSCVRKSMLFSTLSSFGMVPQLPILVHLHVSWALLLEAVGSTVGSDTTSHFLPRQGIRFRRSTTEADTLRTNESVPRPASPLYIPRSKRCPQAASSKSRPEKYTRIPTASPRLRPSLAWELRQHRLYRRE